MGWVGRSTLLLILPFLAGLLRGWWGHPCVEELVLLGLASWLAVGWVR